MPQLQFFLEKDPYLVIIISQILDLLQSDGAVFQGTSANVEGSVVHHNYVYDTEKYAFRYDAPGGDASSAGSYGIMHHNIADNTNGLMIKGNNQIIAHNTIINTQNNKNDIVFFLKIAPILTLGFLIILQKK